MQSDANAISGLTNILINKFPVLFTLVFTLNLRIQWTIYTVLDDFNGQYVVQIQDHSQGKKLLLYMFCLEFTLIAKRFECQRQT